MNTYMSILLNINHVAISYVCAIAESVDLSTLHFTYLTLNGLCTGSSSRRKGNSGQAVGAYGQPTSAAL